MGVTSEALIRIDESKLLGGRIGALGTKIGAVVPVPTITGTRSGQAVGANTTTDTPFATVLVNDPLFNFPNSLTIVLSDPNAGTLAEGPGFGGTPTLAPGPTGTYTLTGTTSEITAELEALTFRAGPGTPNALETTTFTLTDTDVLSTFSSPSDSNTSVTVVPTSFTGVSSAAQLSADITAIDIASQTTGGSGTNYTITLAAGATLAEAADIAAVNLKGTDTLTINGQGSALDGGGAHRGLFVYQGNVTIENLVIQNTAAIGGAGGTAAAGGGGGAGFGGGLLIAGTNGGTGSGGHVVLSNVAFRNSHATGGKGGVGLGLGGSSGGGGGSSGGGGGGGGGGLGGLGGSGPAGGGGGGVGTGAAGGNGLINGAGAPGNVPGGAPGGAGSSFPISNLVVGPTLAATPNIIFPFGSGGLGGPSGGGGGGGAGGGGGGGVAGQNGGAITGGNGGYGGGGGAGPFIGGSGGFGGGGGGSAEQGGSGGFGGGGGGAYGLGSPTVLSLSPAISSGGSGGNGGFGAGDGNLGGGGGLGAGGDIFVQQGGSLVIEGGTLSGGVVAGGAGGAGVGGAGDGTAGSGYGTGIFLQGSGFGSVVLAGGPNGTVVNDVITDQHGSVPGNPNSVGLTVGIAGQAGTVTLGAANTYSGGTSLAAGTLVVTNNGALGSGSLSMAAGTALGFGSGTGFNLANNIALAGDPTVDVALAGQIDTISGVISDTLGQPAGVLDKTGPGTLNLTAANTYSGGTLLEAGRLELGQQSSAGSGPITFGVGPQALQLDAAPVNGSTFADVLTNIGLGDTLDIRGIAFSATDTATDFGNVLTVSNGTTSERFTLSNPATTLFATSQDGAGGTLVTPYVLPTISGTVAGQTTTSETPRTPFSGVTIGDLNSSATETLVIALAGAGGTLTGAGALANGVYTLSGTAGQVTAQLDAVSFTPVAGAPNTQSTTSFTLVDQSSAAAGARATDSTTTVTDIDPAVAPTIAGTHGTNTASEQPVAPFAGVTVGDLNANSIDTLTIAVGGAGGTLAGAGPLANGVYTLTGTAAAVSAALNALQFTPTAGAPNTQSVTSFTLTDSSSAGPTATDSTTSVIDTDPAVAPSITGTVAGQTTTSEAPVTPFAGVTLADLNANATDTLTIQLSNGGAGGTLSGNGLSGGQGGTYTLASGTAASVTSLLEALSFKPAAGAPGSSTTTSFTLTDQSSAGPGASDGTTSVVDIDPGDTTPPMVTFDPTVSFSRPTTATLTGTVSDDVGVAGVTLFEGDTALGAATVNPDGTWSFVANLPRGFHTGLVAVATDTSGNSASAPSDFDLTTGAKSGFPDQPFTAIQDRYDSDGNFLGQTFFERHGAVLFSSTYAVLPNGDSAYTYSGGDFFKGKDYSSFINIYNPDGALIEDIENKRDGSHVIDSHYIEADPNGQTVHSIHNDLFANNGANERFVFSKGFGHDTIAGFKVGGPGHDTIVLPSFDMGHLAHIIANAQTVGGDTTFHVDKQDTITLTTVTKKQLEAHLDDFKFHA